MCNVLTCYRGIHDSDLSGLPAIAQLEELQQVISDQRPLEDGAVPPQIV